MATFTEDERANLGTRGLEDNAEELLGITSQIDTAEESGDVRGYVGRLRALVRDLELAADVLEEACDMAEEREENTCSDCGTALCETCGVCPACEQCCAYEDADYGDDDFPMSLEYDDDDHPGHDIYSEHDL